MGGRPRVEVEGVGHPVFAVLYDAVLFPFERLYYARQRRLVAGGAVGRTLEIGAGTGANFPFYDFGRVRGLTAIEPDPHMRARAEARARRLGLPIEVLDARAEALPFPDGAFDTVVATLVLCTVEDPASALREVRRVLAPGGRFRFMEHVRDEHHAGRRFQEFITPAWRAMAGGCSPARDTAAAIRAAGLEIVELEHLRLAWYPVRPHIRGVARVVPQAGADGSDATRAAARPASMPHAAPTPPRTPGAAPAPPAPRPGRR